METKEDYGIGQFEEPEFIDEGMVDGKWGRSASGLFITDGSRVLLLERASWTQDPGLWGIPGGAIPINSITDEERDPEESAFAETEEEIGGVPAGQVVGENIYQDGDFTYTTYIYKTSPDELEGFEPTLNSEHTDYMLHTIGDDTSGIHPGVIEVINGLKKEVDLKIEQNTQILDNENYVNQMVTRLIIEEFKTKNNISLTADTAKNINTLLVKEYMKEYRGEAA